MVARAIYATFRVKRLSGDQIRRALPLVQLIWPGTDEQAWARYVTFLSRRSKGARSGVLAVGDRSDYLSGVLVYEVEQDIAHGRLLTIHLFTAVDLPNSSALIDRLLQLAQAKAIDLGCAGLQIRLYNRQSAVAAQLRHLGLADYAGYLWLPVEIAGPTRSKHNEP